MPGEHVCRHTAYESPERHKRYNMHGLKQQNAFGWTDITCTCLIYLFLFLFECHFTSFWPPRYINWNIVQSGIKHHKPTNLFLNPKISTWPLLNLFSKNILTGFLYTCINVICIHNLNQFKKNYLIWYSCNTVFMWWQIIKSTQYILNECSQFERLFQVDNHEYFFHCPKKKETVVLILFEIQHPLYHWLAGDLDRG